MGKKNRQNGTANYPDTKEQCIRPVNSYFTSKTVSEQKWLNQNIPHKIADEHLEMETESSFSTKVDLKALENALVGEIEALLQPIQHQLSTMNATLNETKNPSILHHGIGTFKSRYLQSAAIWARNDETKKADARNGH